MLIIIRADSKTARVAKSADAKDLKSFFAQAECGFKSRPGHQLAWSGMRLVRTQFLVFAPSDIAPCVALAGEDLLGLMLSIPAAHQIDRRSLRIKRDFLAVKAEVNAIVVSHVRATNSGFQFAAKGMEQISALS